MSWEPQRRDEVRERGERDARFFAWDVPGDAHVVALVHEAGDAERSATVADAIATSVARRREHTLLFSAEPGPSPLDELLEAANSEGLPAALEGRVRLTDVAVQRVDRPFVYLPGGSNAAAMRALLQDHVLVSFIDRVRERGGTLFIVLSDETILIDRLRELIDGYVALGEVSLPEVEGFVEFGRVRFEDAEGGAEAHLGNGSRSGPLASPEPVAELTPLPGHLPRPEVDDHWRRHLEKPGIPLARVALGVGGILGIFAIWWGLAGGWSAGANAGAEPSGGRIEPASFEAGSTAPAPDPPFDPNAALAAFGEAPELAYSVQIASFAARADAQDRLAELRASGAGFFFISPTPVGGGVYHRVFAGALEGRHEADSLMQALVAAGKKTEAVRWDVRPTRLAFDLGVYPSEDEANDRVRELAALDISAYALWARSDGEEAWRVYGGAFTADREAAPMAEQLLAVGEPAELMPRRGYLPLQP